MGKDSRIHLCTWVDATYVLHPYLNRNIGLFVPFRYWMLYCKSSKHKMNIKISTEAEVVGFSDYLPLNILICLFMGYEGYGIKQNILFQFNQSEIKMGEKRG